MFFRQLISNLTPVDIKLSGVSNNLPPGVTYKCRYNPVSKTVLFTAHFPSRNSLVYEKGTSYNMYNVPDEYMPSNRCALAVYGGSSSGLQATVGTNGTIQILPQLADVAVSKIFTLTGEWFVK